MRTAFVVVAAAAVLAAGAISAFGSTPSVKWHDPTSSTVKIKKGGSVKWVWTGDGLPHGVKGPGFHSAVSSKKGFSYTHRFNKKGTFTIICIVHGSAMTTKVKVS